MIQRAFETVSKTWEVLCHETRWKIGKKNVKRRLEDKSKDKKNEAWEKWEIKAKQKRQDTTMKKCEIGDLIFQTQYWSVMRDVWDEEREFFTCW